jgi:hypothetical protein
MMLLGMMGANAAAGGGGSGPVVLSSVTGEASSGSTVPVVIQPVNAGDLLVCVYGNARPRGFGTTAGWTNALAETTVRPCMAIAHRIADGTEAGTTVNFALSGTTSPGAVALVFRVQAGTFNTSSPVEAIGAASGSSLAPNSPNLSPSWGSGTHRWFAASLFSKTDNAQSVTSWPYTDNQTTAAHSGAAGAGIPIIALCGQTITGASSDPAAFGIGFTSDWIAQTFAVRGA